MQVEEKQKAMENVKVKAADKISKSQEYQKQTYARRAMKKYKNIVYHVGEEVLLLNMRKRGRKGGKIKPDFSGPYVIKAITGKLVSLSNSSGIT